MHELGQVFRALERSVAHANVGDAPRTQGPRRPFERAENLAELVHGRAISFHDWIEQCREIDILISSTSADEPLLTPEILAPTLRGRTDRPLFIIDIAVPRDVAPEVNEMDGVYLYDIDSLQLIAAQSLAMRRQQIAAGEEIIAEHVSDFSARFGRGNASTPPLAARILGDSTMSISEP